MAVECSPTPPIHTTRIKPISSAASSTIPSKVWQLPLLFLPWCVPQQKHLTMTNEPIISHLYCFCRVHNLRSNATHMSESPSFWTQEVNPISKHDNPSKRYNSAHPGSSLPCGQPELLLAGTNDTSPTPHSTPGTTCPHQQTERTHNASLPVDPSPHQYPEQVNLTTSMQEQGNQR